LTGHGRSSSIQCLELSLLLPLLGGIVYVAAALLLKRAAQNGADVWRTVRACNFASALMFVPLTLLGGKVPGWELWWQPALVAFLYVVGQALAMFALKIGDVSVSTPVLGLKILLVGVLTTALLGEKLGGELWAAAALSSAAIALLNISGGHPHHRIGATIALSVGAAVAYALFDVLVQKWSAAWGPGRFVPAVMWLSALYSVVIGLGRPPARPQSGSTNWFIAGAIFFGLQGCLFVTAIAVYGQATVANVLYSSRGLWSVVAVWLVGHWFGNEERHLPRQILVWRLLGAALLMVAILLVLFGR
jgi:drug/metabolite transporter (DMT)-like permease